MDWRVQILGAIATAFATILTAATPFLVRAIIRKIETSMNIDVTEANERALERAAVQAVAWAEEQARVAMKSRGVSMPSDEKRAAASAFVLATLERQGVVIDEETVSRALDSVLHRFRSERTPEI